MSKRNDRVAESPSGVTSSASTYWNATRLTRAGRVLTGRRTSLRADIARELRKHDDERLSLLAANVADSAELSIADLIGDLYLAEIERDVRDLDDVERALQRIAAGSYGSCLDCGRAIDPMRLGFHPQVARCLHCQEGAEQALGLGKRSVTL